MRSSVRFVVVALASSAPLFSAVDARAEEGGYEDPRGRAPVVAPPPGTEDRYRGEYRGTRRPPRRAEEFEETRRPAMLGPEGFPLAGEHGGRFFLRSETDSYRLYPGLLLQLDTRSALGRGIREMSGPASESTRTRLEVRRARLDLGGQVHDAWSFLVTGDFARSPRLEHALVDLRLSRWAHITIGQQQVPFTMENRTDEGHYAWLERPLAVRFAQPSNKDLGVMVWGEAPRGLVGYEVGVFGGDGANRPNVDDRADAAGRIYVKPLRGTGTIARDIHIGASGTIGMRQRANVSYSMDPLTTDGGYAFWTPSHVDANGQSVNVIPSGVSRGFAGEVRIPVSRLDLRFEFVSVRRNTREAVEGFEASSTERFGHLTGTGFYAQLGVWVMGSPGMRRDPGRFRPPRLAFPRGEPIVAPRGLEILARVDAVRVTYTPGDRASPTGESSQEQTVSATIVGAGVNYYATPHASISLGWGYSIFPRSGTPQNAALAPGNLGCNQRTIGAPAPSGLPCRPGSHSLQELAARVQITF
jgi:phosphate-selective porin